MKITPTFLSAFSLLAVTGASRSKNGISTPAATLKETYLETSKMMVPSPPSVLWIRPSTTILDTDSNRYQKDFTRVLTISRGGGWLSDAAKDVEGSAASAKEKATKAFSSASSKTTDIVAKAKADAEQAWLKRVEELEQQLKEEKVKASKRLESEQKRLKVNAEKEKARLQTKIVELRQKLRRRKRY